MAVPAALRVILLLADESVSGESLVTLSQSHVKKKAPNYCVLPDSGGHCGPKGKPATFFPVLFFFLKRGQL